MNKPAVLLLSVLGLAAIVTRAEAAPPWCATPGVERIDLTGLADLYRETKPWEALYTLVAATCAPDAEARTQTRQIEATRQAWSKKLAMTEADWADVAQWTTAPQQARMNGRLDRVDDKLAPSGYGPTDQYEALGRATDPAYLADVFGDRLTQAGRLGYLGRCLAGGPVAWAMCQADIDGFDAGKLSAELRTDARRTGFDRTRLRIEAHAMVDRLAVHAQEVAALVAKDPAYAQLFALAKIARQDWRQVDPTLIALTNSLEDARVTNSRRASDGCVDRTWQAWQAQVAELPAKTFTGFEDGVLTPFLPQALAKIVASPDGYLAGFALVQCAVLVQQDDHLLRELSGLIERWPGFRGPRTATHTRILAAGVVLDDRDAQLGYPDVAREGVQVASYHRGGAATGTIAKLETRGDTVTVTFAKIKGKQQKCVRGKTTNRVVQIRSDGTLVYEYVCLALRTETYAEPPAPPTEVAARYAAGLAPGMFVTVIDGVVAVAYRKGSTTPAAITGVAVK